MSFSLGSESLFGGPRRREKTEAQKVTEFAEKLNNRIKQDVDFYMAIIAKHDSNEMKVCQLVLKKLERGIVDVEEIWNESDFIGSFIKFYNSYIKFLNLLPVQIADEIVEHIEPMISKFFNSLL